MYFKKETLTRNNQITQTLNKHLGNYLIKHHKYIKPHYSYGMRIDNHNFIEKFKAVKDCENLINPPLIFVNQTTWKNDNKLRPELNPQIQITFNDQTNCTPSEVAITCIKFNKLFKVETNPYFNKEKILLPKDVWIRNEYCKIDFLTLTVLNSKEVSKVMLGIDNRNGSIHPEIKPMLDLLLNDDINAVVKDFSSIELEYLNILLLKLIMPEKFDFMINQTDIYKVVKFGDFSDDNDFIDKI